MKKRFVGRFGLLAADDKLLVLDRHIQFLAAEAGDGKRNAEIVRAKFLNVCKEDSHLPLFFAVRSKQPFQVPNPRRNGLLK